MCLTNPGYLLENARLSGAPDLILDPAANARFESTCERGNERTGSQTGDEEAGQEGWQNRS